MLYESEDIKVSHPSHYQASNGMEVINVIESFTADMNGIEATDTGNIIKYACRWKNKNGIQDLEKILWYTQHLIDHLERGNFFDKNDEKSDAQLRSHTSKEEYDKGLEQIKNINMVLKKIDLKEEYNKGKEIESVDQYIAKRKKGSDNVYSVVKKQTNES